MRSKYTPQLSMWREDLYKGVYSRSERLTSNKKLRFYSNDYCELSRRTSGMGYGSYLIYILLVFMLFVCLFGISFSIFDMSSILLNNNMKDRTFTLPLLGGLLSLSLFYIFATLLNYSIFAPKDCPIRLNRKTGKVYIYDYILLNLSTKGLFTSPFFRVTRPVQKEFNWQDIQAVLTSMAAPVSTGGMIRSYVIRCVVCKPGTTEMADHFCLTADSSLSYDEWMWINSYMAFSDGNLDTTTFEKDNVPGKTITWKPEYDEKAKVTSPEEYQSIAAHYSN
ncbi:hypothetical protein LPW36_15865 [Jinshanibacter sp. LJY008]|uniref:DUF6708 domain-containing protein n=1 Tax=Limnobaculum eriocheiris TaxID=2897391 RepID=A0A9X1N154_9GAMM|nr:DUF6708 domain-containing protein [Limnobaculum eriocheiris]MCD1127452.1 hypothetical protein [Limnobaculum eriocheiris]